MLKDVCFPALTAGYPCLLDARTVSVSGFQHLSNPCCTSPLCNLNSTNFSSIIVAPHSYAASRCQMQRQHSHCTPCSHSFHSRIVSMFLICTETSYKKFLIYETKRPNSNCRKTQPNQQEIEKNCKNHHSTA